MGYVRHDWKIESERLGGMLVVGAAVILAIRTARREALYNPHESNRDWDAEIHFAVDLTKTLLMYATTHHAELFRQVPIVYPNGIHEEDIPL